MKKLLVLALAFMMLLSVIACSNPTTSDPTPCLLYTSDAADE